ncbi:hypothetical protein SCLCIDRAFT_1211900 [Scleroderma citrinum Foug A]|uniref:Uncharacterized protein n=1 Tax=Scleroderma citrinum Foug A TaxID=1036808 RepID=A0A0C3DZ94_9AGAM|nr:hypothetical protein SCLCIDRAFT_1211900 [Scleroderma citrinum Foug A]
MTKEAATFMVHRRGDDNGKDGTMSGSTVDSTERGQLESACASTPENEVRRPTCVAWATHISLKASMWTYVAQRPDFFKSKPLQPGRSTYTVHVTCSMLMTWPPSSNYEFMARPLYESFSTAGEI